MPKATAPVVAAGSLARHPQPHLAVGELSLRPWIQQDVPALVEAYRDPAIQRWHARTLTVTEAEEFVLLAQGAGSG